jgi:hypothetical protein
MSKEYSVPIRKGNAVARVAAVIPALTMLGAYKHAPINSGYLGYKPRQVIMC